MSEEEMAHMIGKRGPTRSSPIRKELAFLIRMGSTSWVHLSRYDHELDLTAHHVKLPPDDPTCAHVMEYIEGKSLCEYTEEIKMRKYLEEPQTRYVRNSAASEIMLTQNRWIPCSKQSFIFIAMVLRTEIYFHAT